MVVGHQGTVIQLGAEIAGMHIGDDLARVSFGSEIFARKSVQRTGIGTGNLDGIIERICEREFGQCGRPPSVVR